MKMLIGMVAMIMVIFQMGFQSVILIEVHGSPKLANDLNIPFLIGGDMVGLIAFFYIMFFALRALFPSPTRSINVVVHPVAK